MNVDLFHFDLPDRLVALRPVVPRDSARLLVITRDGSFSHTHVRNFPDFLSPGDGVVFNDSKVIPARLRGRRVRLGAEIKVEVLLCRRQDPATYWALAKPARKLMPDDHLILGDGLEATVVARGEGGDVQLRFALAGAALDQAIAAQGEMPLPPYIAGKRKTDVQDLTDYQTVFAREEGSVAAPTAGLHFTPQMFASLGARGVTRENVTLHVGPGTFLPVTAADTDSHRMHGELATLSGAAAARLNGVKQAGGRIAAVGTTSLRTLESAADDGGQLQPFAGETEIFITPGYRFKAVDILLTNFHLPRSTLFMLVSAFMGLDVMQAAYAEAIREGYRFYSYGDACLLMGGGS